MASLKIEQAVNTQCPWSGRPVSADSLVRYRGHTVGFCNPGCRDKFRVAVEVFDVLIGESRTVGDANADSR